MQKGSQLYLLMRKDQTALGMKAQITRNSCSIIKPVVVATLMDEAENDGESDDDDGDDDDDDD